MSSSPEYGGRSLKENLVSLLKRNLALLSRGKTRHLGIPSRKVLGNVGEHLPPDGMTVSGAGFSFEVGTSVQQGDFQRFPRGWVGSLFCNLTG
jgi:hypothetical protein